MSRMSAPRVLKAFYFFNFAGVAVFLPYLTLYYRWVGLSGAEMGALTAASRLGGTLSPPLWGLLADKSGRRKEILLGASLLSLLTFMAIGLTAHLSLLLPLALFFSVLRAPLTPLADSATLQHLRETQEGEYGRIRLWGSLGFILAALATGRLLEGHTPRVIFPVYLLLGGVLLGVLLRFPPEAGEMRRGLLRGLGRLISRREFSLFIICSFISWLSWGAYSVFFTVYLDALGIRGSLIGLAWIVGVVSEVFILAWAEKLRAHLGLRLMIFLGMLSAALRWYLTALTVNAAYLVAIQALHGLAWGAFHVAAVSLVDELSPQELKATGQSIYSAATYGLGGGLGAALMGYLYDLVGMIAILKLSAGIALAAAGIFFFFSGEVRTMRKERH